MASKGNITIPMDDYNDMIGTQSRVDAVWSYARNAKTLQTETILYILNIPVPEREKDGDIDE